MVTRSTFLAREARIRDIPYGGTILLGRAVRIAARRRSADLPDFSRARATIHGTATFLAWDGTWAVLLGRLFRITAVGRT